MGKSAKSNAIRNRRLKKKATKKAQRTKEVKRLRALGWPTKRVPPLSKDAQKTEDVDLLDTLEKRIAEATSMKALQDLAREVGIPQVRNYKAADREDLEEAVRDAAKAAPREES